MGDSREGKEESLSPFTLENSSSSAINSNNKAMFFFPRHSCFPDTVRPFTLLEVNAHIPKYLIHCYLCGPDVCIWCRVVVGGGVVLFFLSFE